MVLTSIPASPTYLCCLFGEYIVISEKLVKATYPPCLFQLGVAFIKISTQDDTMAMSILKMISCSQAKQSSNSSTLSFSPLHDRYTEIINMGFSPCNNTPYIRFSHLEWQLPNDLDLFAPLQQLLHICVANVPARWDHLYQLPCHMLPDYHKQC